MVNYKAIHYYYYKCSLNEIKKIVVNMVCQLQNNKILSIFSNTFDHPNKKYGKKTRYCLHTQAI